jgi:endonuclease-3
MKTKSAKETDREAEAILTKQDLSRLHHSLIFFWRYFCTARKPKCSECSVRGVCDYGSVIID